jgi:RNase P subunit RPR2
MGNTLPRLTVPRMQCESCGGFALRVRSSEERAGGVLWRYVQCLGCGARMAVTYRPAGAEARSMKRE